MRTFIFLISAIFYSTIVQSATYNFDVMYDGVSQTELATISTQA